MKGTIISWFDRRNYGFVKPDVPVEGLPPEVFVHGSDVLNPKYLQSPIANTRVSFELGKFGGRTKAVNVTVVPR